jgi:uncharacterized protein YjiS (DUF1127 family)
MTQAVLVAHSYLTRTVELLIEFFKSLKQARKLNKLQRQTYNELMALSDKDLNDIGIHRGDIRYIAYQNQNLKGWV